MASRRRPARHGSRRGPAAGGEDPRRLAARARAGAAAPRRARAEHVGRGEQAGGRVQLGAAHASRVARPVDALVVAARDQAQRREHRRPGEDAPRVVGVQAHELPLVGPQRTRPLPDAGRHRHPAEVVQQPGPVGELPRRRARPARPPRAPARRRHASGRGTTGVLRSAASPNPASASSRAASSRNARRGAGSASTTAAHRSSGLDSREQLGRCVRKIAAIAGSSARPDQRATVAAATRPADRVEHHGGEADGGEPSSLGDLFAGPARGRAVAVEALEPVEDRAAGRRRAAAAGGSGRRRPRSPLAPPRL